MSQPNARENRILQALPPAERRRILGALERVTLPLGEVLARPRQPLRAAYFPLGGVISAVVVLERGSTVEGLTIGNEGMIGLGLLTGLEPKQFQFLVQVAGEVLRVRADRFRQIVAGSAAWADLLLRYAVVQINAAIVNAACHRHHTVEERMCRWLLETSWRIGRDQFELTQEFLSELLGTRRQSVNLIARVLQRAGLIDYRRGEVTILDRAGLEAAACACFRTTQAAYDAAIPARTGER